MGQYEIFKGGGNLDGTKRQCDGIILQCDKTEGHCDLTVEHYVGEWIIVKGHWGMVKEQLINDGQ